MIRRALNHAPVTIALVAWLVTAAGVGIAAADPTTPVGLVGGMPTVDRPAGSPATLMEGVPLLNWAIDADTGWTDPVGSVMNSLVNVVWNLAVVLAYAACALAQWVVGLTHIQGLNDLMVGALGYTNQSLMSWLAPTALALGALIAYLNRRAGEGINQVLIVAFSALLGFSLAWTPSVWINATQNARDLGTTAVLGVTTGAVDPDQSKPFAWPASDYAGATVQQAALRKASDATFRGLVAYPWCLIEFGSLEACERYGSPIVQLPAGSEERKQQIQRTVYPAEGGDTAPTSKWVKGADWPQRLVIALVSLLVTLVFAGLLLVLGFAAAGAIIETALHLLIGAPFALTWCVPGWPRQVGIRWVESLVGSIVQSIAAVGIFAAILAILTTFYANIASLGGLVAVWVLAIVTLGVGISFRHRMASWFGALAGGHTGAALIGAMILRTATRGLSRVASGAGRAGSRAMNRNGSKTPKGAGQTSRRDYMGKNGAPGRGARTAMQRGGRSIDARGSAGRAGTPGAEGRGARPGPVPAPSAGKAGADGRTGAPGRVPAGRGPANRPATGPANRPGRPQAAQQRAGRPATRNEPRTAAAPAPTPAAPRPSRRAPAPAASSTGTKGNRAPARNPSPRAATRRLRRQQR